MRRKQPSLGRSRRQRGLTLIEFMISIVLGMILVAALAVLIANQSANRSELDRSGRMIENGRFAIQTIAEDVQMAGYWGEISSTPDAPTSVTTLGTMPNPCSAVMNATEDSANPGLKEGTLLHVQGYDGSTFTSGTLSCVSNWKSGTDVLVVRHADPDYSALANSSGVVQAALLANSLYAPAGQVYLQTGLNAASEFVYTLRAGDPSTNVANFPNRKLDGSIAPPRKLVVHMYYVADCDVCTGSDADTIPTLKRVDLGISSGSPAMGNPMTIAPGIENLQIDYGVDDSGTGDGSPDGADVNAADVRLNTADKWRNAMSATIYLLARATEKSPGVTDTKSYCLGTLPCYSPATGVAAYRRHVFTQTVRMANPSQRRSS